MRESGSRPIDGLFQRVGFGSLLLSAIPPFAIAGFAWLFAFPGLGIGLAAFAVLIEIPYVWYFSSAHRCKVCGHRQRQRDPEPWVCRDCGRVGWSDR